MDKIFLKAKPAYLLYVFFVLFALQSTVVYALEENAKIGLLFDKAHVQGTFVLYDTQQKKLLGHNTIRSIKPYIPASTFKITNSLIGLVTDAVEDVDEPLPYTGPNDPFIKEWKRDMGLREAIKLSNVPIYQELARRIGLKRMQEHLSLIHYGNEKIGTQIDRFWLDGPLEISALEYVEFLTKLVQKELPYPDKIQTSVHDILILEQEKGWKLYGKTGWQNAPDEGVGWFVGWLEQHGNLYIFALNIDIVNTEDAQKRIALTKACLSSLGLL